MQRLTPIFALFLTLALVLSSVSMALMGHGAGGRMLVELCGSDTEVFVDLPGGPAPGSAPACPDCLLHLGAAPLPVLALCLPVLGRTAQITPHFLRLPQATDHGPNSRARAPPILM